MISEIELKTSYWLNVCLSVCVDSQNAAAAAEAAAVVRFGDSKDSYDAMPRKLRRGSIGLEGCVHLLVVRIATWSARQVEATTTMNGRQFFTALQRFISARIRRPV